MEDLQIIKEIEKQLDIHFNIPNEKYFAKYSMDKNNKVEMLSINNIAVKDLSLICKLKELGVLILKDTQLEDISALSELEKIHILDIGNCLVKDISPIKKMLKNAVFIIDAKNNPLKYPPIEIVELGKEAIMEYFEHCEKGTSILKEAKLIVIGEAGAGKTTFAKRVQKADAPMPKPNETTLGVEVNKWFFGGDYKYLDYDSNDFNTGYYTKIWDFGGQDIYHGTHQFFYSDKSLYVLLADTREQKTDFNYWLNTVEQLTGENSPLVIILNKKHQHIWQIDEPGLKRRFGEIIRTVVEIDLSQTSEIYELQKLIKKEILDLPYIGYILPKSWVSIRSELSKLEDKFISFERFRNVCKNYAITNSKLVEIISKLFANIGIFTHFSEDFSSLREIIYLDANWLTKTVYLLLNHEVVKIKKGRITLDDIKLIWQNDEIYFEINKFIELLMKFSLIYKINGSNNYIVPEHLPVVQPYDNWRFSGNKDNYQFRYLFDNYMPKGLMAKLIVALHRFIYDNSLVWHRGVNIANSTKEPDTFAEIIETYGSENRFDIRIYGKNPKELLQVIIYHFDNILKHFKKLTHQKLVPCNCDVCKTNVEPHFYKYETLLKLKKYDKDTVRCEKEPFLDTRIDELLEGITNSKLRTILANANFEEFKEVLSKRFSDISYQIHKGKITESYFHSILHTILAENSLNPVSEESTNSGRIDLHLTIGHVKYLFELKVDKTAKEALLQIEDNKYYRKYQRDFKEINLIGINFSSKTRNIQELISKTIKQ